MSRLRDARLRSLVSLVVAITVVPATTMLPMRLAHAQKPATAPSKKELEAARKNFMDGLDLEKAEQWTEARGRFEEVAKVRMTPEVRFHIALCEEHEGLLLEALRDFETAESDAKAEGKTAVMAEAPQHANAIKPRIPKVKVKAPDDVEAMTLTLDGMPIDPKNSDELPINPGPHKIEASAEGHVPFVHEFKLTEGESKTVTVKLPPIGEEKVEKEEPEPGPEPEKPDVELRRKTPVLAYVVTGVGVASLIGAGVFYGLRKGAENDLASSCEDLRCKPEQQGTIDSGKTYTLLTNVFAIIGIVGVGTGVYLFLSAPKEEVAKEKEKEKETTSLRLVPGAPGADVGGFALVGAF
ncbi:MAG: hypothetical protein ABI175_08035 [Polyangiales bacterium]